LKQRYTEYEDEQILVHCASGVSRSVTVTTAVLASIKEVPYAEELERIQSVLDLVQDPAGTLEGYASLYLNEQ
jgi:protein-tyrosine phosphatase